MLPATWLTWPDLGDNGLAMAKTTEQPDLVNRFKELWINELMPTFKKDLLTELKTEIAKQVKFVTERFESKIRDLDKKLNNLETSQSFVSSKFDAFTAGLANTKKDIKSLNDKVTQLEDSISHFENDLYDNMACTFKLGSLSRFLAISAEIWWLVKLLEPRHLSLYMVIKAAAGHKPLNQQNFQW